MGHGAKLGVVKKSSEVEKRDALSALAEDLRGELLPHDAYTRCPKCAAERKVLRKQFCPGYDERMEHLDAAPRDLCHLAGEHLHGNCVRELGGCGFEWREETKDAGSSSRAARVE